MIMLKNPISVHKGAVPTRKPGKKRSRLSDKQKAFLAGVFLDGKSVLSARHDLLISPHILNKWLQKPRFLQAIETYLSGCQEQARIMASREAPISINSMTIFIDAREPKTARQACVDLWKTYRTFYDAYKDAKAAAQNDKMKIRSANDQRRSTNDYFRKEFAMENQPVLQKPKRLTRKQKWFLISVMDACQPIEHAMDEYKISPRLLHAWLQQPHFLRAVEIRLAQFHLQARIEAAKSACHAVKSLAELTGKSMKHEVVRQASMDLLKIHHDFDTDKFSRQVAQKCFPTVRKCEKVAPKCAPLRLSGTKMRADAHESIGENTYTTPTKPHSQPKNKENIRFPFHKRESCAIDLIDRS